MIISQNYELASSSKETQNMLQARSYQCVLESVDYRLGFLVATGTKNWTVIFLYPHTVLKLLT